MDVDLDVLLLELELLFIELAYSFFFFLNLALKGSHFVELLVSSKRKRPALLFLEPFLHDVHLFHYDFVALLEDSLLLIKAAHLTLKDYFLFLDFFATALQIILSLVSCDKLSMQFFVSILQILDLSLSHHQISIHIF